MLRPKRSHCVTPDGICHQPSALRRRHPGAWSNQSGYRPRRERRRDKAAKARYYNPGAAVATAEANDVPATGGRSRWSWLNRFNPWR
jgi:hypothetical protein